MAIQASGHKTQGPRDQDSKACPPNHPNTTCAPRTSQTNVHVQTPGGLRFLAHVQLPTSRWPFRQGRPIHLVHPTTGYQHEKPTEFPRPAPPNDQMTTCATRTTRTTGHVAYTRRPAVPRSSAKAAKDPSAKGGLKPRTRSGHRPQHRPTAFRQPVQGAYSDHQPLKTMNPGLASRVHSGEHGLFSRSDRHRSRAALRAARTQVHDHA